MAKVKYIRTKNNEIIVFSDLQQHSDFKHFEPISAGFISIGIGEDKNPDCTCYGRSISLNLDSLPDDTLLAKRQILGWDYY
jgi:hypothetical protein